MNKIILASGSPRRKQLLQLAEIPFDVIVAETDETYPGNLSSSEIAIHIAENKALAVQVKLQLQHNPHGQTIISADTIVVLDNELIAKPEGREDAVQILMKLSGKKHKVITGVCILSGYKKNCLAEETEVEFHTLSLSQIEHYVDFYKPYDKAGAYAIQEWIGAIGIKSIKGDFYNVMGLPVSRVIKELNEIQFSMAEKKVDES